MDVLFIPHWLANEIERKYREDASNRVVAYFKEALDDGSIAPIPDLRASEGPGVSVRQMRSLDSLAQACAEAYEQANRPTYIQNGD